MAITVSSIAVAGTACPWKVGTLSSNINGSSGILEPYNTPFYDGSQTGGGAAGQNAAYPYGKAHTHAGETSPTTLAVTPGQIIILEFVSGTINTQGSGATSCGPAGVATTGITPYPAGGCDNETFPTNVIRGYNGINKSGTVNTSGTAVTWASGDKFVSGMVGGVLWINSVAYVISAVSAANNTSITLASTAGTQTGVAYYYWSAATSIGGLVGAFTDASGNIVSTFDWAGYKGINPPGAFTLTSVSNTGSGAQYNGTITGGGTPANVYAGYFFTIAGFTNAANNGTFLCIASSAFSITVVNANALAETHAGTAQLLSWIALRVPAGAAFISLGNNDTALFDNTGSFSLSAVQMDSVAQWVGSANPFAKPPFGGCPTETAFMPDKRSSLLSTVAMCCVPISQKSTSPFSKYFTDQLYPQGKN
jgi:hypothetical protein